MENNLAFLQNKISLFESCNNSIPKWELSFEELFKEISNSKYDHLLAEYRHMVNRRPEDAKKFKSTKLPAFTAAGTFSKREKSGLVAPSGIAVIDVDDVPVEKLAGLMDEALNHGFTLAVMKSPGGRGFKIFVPIHYGWSPETYEHRYKEAAKYYSRTFNIPIADKRKKGGSSWGIDASCSDITRLCIIGSDAVVNPNASLFAVYETISQNEEKVIRIIDRITEAKTDITSGYQTWFEIACSLKYEFGEDGRKYFHEVSRFYPDYKAAETDKLFDGIHHQTEKKITIGSFFHIAKEYGIGNIAIPRISVSAPLVNEQKEKDDGVSGLKEIKLHSFPTEIFPPEIANFIAESSLSINCAPDYIAVSVLSILSAMIGRKVAISPKPGHTENASLFCIVVGDPGQKKSPAIKVATYPVEALQTSYYLDYKKQKEQYDAADDKEGMTKPELVRLITNDFTIEALGSILEANPIGLAVVSDEIMSMILAFNQYKSKGGNDKQKFLSFWSSTAVYIDRKNQEPKQIPAPFISLNGGIQPEVLNSFSGKYNDGFLDRLLFVFPAARDGGYSAHVLEDEVIEVYRQKIVQLHYLGREEFFERGRTPQILNFSKEQFDKWLNWVNKHHAETRHERFPYYLKGVWAKMEAHSLRFILIVACSRTTAFSELKINLEDVDNGIKLAEYFKRHISSVFQVIYSSENDLKVDELYSYLKKNGGRDSARNIYRKHVAKCKNKKDVDILFKEMVDRELGTIEKFADSTGKKASDYFVLK